MVFRLNVNARQYGEHAPKTELKLHVQVPMKDINAVPVPTHLVQVEKAKHFASCAYPACSVRVRRVDSLHGASLHRREDTWLTPCAFFDRCQRWFIQCIFFFFLFFFFFSTRHLVLAHHLRVQLDNKSPPKLSFKFSCKSNMLNIGILVRQVYEPKLLIGRKNANRLLLLLSRFQYWRHRAR